MKIVLVHRIRQMEHLIARLRILWQHITLNYRFNCQIPTGFIQVPSYFYLSCFERAVDTYNREWLHNTGCSVKLLSTFGFER